MLSRRYLVTNCLKKARKLFKKEKSCTKSEKLFEGLKVAPNLKSCSKVAEQLMYNPTVRSFLRSFVCSFVVRSFVCSFVLSFVRSLILRSLARPSVRLFLRPSVRSSVCVIVFPRSHSSQNAEKLKAKI